MVSPLAAVFWVMRSVRTHARTGLIADGACHGRDLRAAASLRCGVHRRAQVIFNHQVSAQRRASERVWGGGIRVGLHAYTYYVSRVQACSTVFVFAELAD
jgi:hypothetical protein